MNINGTKETIKQLGKCFDGDGGIYYTTCDNSYWQSWQIWGHEFCHALHWQIEESLGTSINGWGNILLDIREYHALESVNRVTGTESQMLDNKYSPGCLRKAWNGVFPSQEWSNTRGKYFKRIK